MSEVLTLGGVKRKAGCFSKFLRGSSGWNKSLENKQVFLALMKNNEIFSYRGFSWCALALGSIEFKPNLRRTYKEEKPPGKVLPGLTSTAVAGSGLDSHVLRKMTLV